MIIEFFPKGVCSHRYLIEIDDSNDTIKSCHIEGGCAGNLLGISKIIKDMKVQDVVKAFEGTKCGFKNTSCPDQISKALRQYLDNK